MNDPIFDALHAEIDAAEARMDAAGVPKLRQIECFVCRGAGCDKCNQIGTVNTDAVTP